LDRADLLLSLKQRFASKQFRKYTTYESWSDSMSIITKERHAPIDHMSTEMSRSQLVMRARTSTSSRRTSSTISSIRKHESVSLSSCDKGRLRSPESKHDLGRSVPSRSDIFSHVCTRVIRSLVEATTETEVANLEFAICVDQEVTWLEISVDDSSGVNVLHP
jgi:hypothetical protein